MKVKIISFRESEEIPAQTMTEAAFWHRGINLKFSETSLSICSYLIFSNVTNEMYINHYSITELRAHIPEWIPCQSRNADRS